MPVRTLVALLILTLAAPLAAADRTFTEAVHGRGELRYVDGVPVLFLEGSPEEIGRQEAALVMPVVKPLLGLPRRMLGDRGGEVGWPIAAGVARGMLARAPERFRREADAAAEQAGLTPDEADAFVVANAMIELRRIGGCSALIVEPARSATGGMLFGRNLDFPTFGHLDRLNLVSAVRPEGKKAFVSVGWPGLIGVVSGMNEDGLTVANLDVYSSKDGSPMFDPLGVPLALTYRRILEECATVAEADALLRTIRHTTWMNLACCDPERAVVFEITPERIVVRTAERHLLACTNHFRTPALCTSRECDRYAKFEPLIGRDDRLGLEQVREAMHAVNQGEMTIQTMLFEPPARAVHVSLGDPPASSRALTRLDLKMLFAPRPAAEP